MSFLLKITSLRHNTLTGLLDDPNRLKNRDSGELLIKNLIKINVEVSLYVIIKTP